MSVGRGGTVNRLVHKMLFEERLKKQQVVTATVDVTFYNSKMI